MTRRRKVAKNNSGYERITLTDAAAMLGVPTSRAYPLLSDLDRIYKLRPRREPRGLTYDLLAFEKVLRRKRIPTPGGDWLSDYEKENLS